MSFTEQAISAALATIIDPNTGKDFVSTRGLKQIKIDGNNVSLDIELGYPAKSQFARIAKGER